MTYDELPDFLQSKINVVEENFNFAKVKLVMETLNWKWYGTGVPSIQQMQNITHKLLVDACSDCFEFNKNGYHGTGGFVAECYKLAHDYEVTLKFVAEEYSE